MRNLFRAEWIKVAGNRWVAGCLIWIFPVGGIAFIALAALILALSPAARDGFEEDGPSLWTEQAVGVWNLANNPVGRLILLSFTAVVFAGEYQWSTWKNVVPRNRRTSLILFKFLVLGTFVVTAFVLMSILWSLGWGGLTLIAGASYGPAISSKVLSDFAQDYALQAGMTFTATIIGAGYAALAAMATRSILGGVLVGFGVTFAENLSIVAFVIIGYFLKIPRVVHLYRFTPGYNLINITEWVNNNAPSKMDVDVGSGNTVMLSNSLELSLFVLAVWVIGLIALTAYLFRRQDITS
ncbi:MAG: hypothetical protein HY866_03935 [Chloroflexi bacterium]|nr:hypothetical protein [Chloroflexota bacterium]